MDLSAPVLDTPDTSHVSYSRVYEPAEDSFLLLDTLSSPSETSFLQARFPSASPVPLVLEVGTGSGVVLAFATAHACAIFGTRAVLTAGVDINAFACAATAATVRKAAAEHLATRADAFLGAVRGDLVCPWRNGVVDVLIFNPPYVPTEELPRQDDDRLREVDAEGRTLAGSRAFERDSYLLSLSYAGGRDGMETTDRLIQSLPEILSARGCAYLLLCAQNKPEKVKARIKGFGPGWMAETVRESGKQAGWEKLQVLRIWQERSEGDT
ncbi:ERF1 methyltransferase catalytic subunit MTQ2 [Pleurostoma richardsiae]|uniref:ERF1 methyltransferase catalytic subunit MTQ2 n=1 Tax=Pleurostoma richardsiae TaxID=41990 RepID=A0AA38R729_9PEZI|nr:ERF1 methyltransferase catalytic subunit MTQ2 [Pleurostoma richardsiae]